MRLELFCYLSHRQDSAETGQVASFWLAACHYMLWVEASAEDSGGSWPKGGL